MEHISSVKVCSRWPLLAPTQTASQGSRRQDGRLCRPSVGVQLLVNHFFTRSVHWRVLCKALLSSMADTCFTAVAKLTCAEFWGGDVQWTHLQRVPTADGQRVHRAGGPAPGRADRAGDDGFFCSVPGRWPQERCVYREQGGKSCSHCTKRGCKQFREVAKEHGDRTEPVNFNEQACHLECGTLCVLATGHGNARQSL